ncbi:DNA integrity scanning protein DisA nucleotide-binding domain protein [Desulfatibacillum aliphaticivorans]|uniref:DNA integrity scanning protein DisA nucleotide-binding domain protein n=1 Tax=Desulfatibacillum aliphaticivorans TaxID=218208 RepID=UPI000413AE8B|nr:DNA integrity scanning protein DisA nucleotide-binding domain protein [Desulfatibacillum aliphaticivorans]
MQNNHYPENHRGQGSKQHTENLSIFHIADGLADGLSHFSGVSRIALIYAVSPGEPLRIYDPQNLLDGHEILLKKIYLDSCDWKQDEERVQALKLFDPVLPAQDLGLTGLISFGGMSQSAYYQMWFTEHHPDICNPGPTRRWLEHATWLLSHDLATCSEFYSSMSDYILREYATHAVRDCLVDELNMRVGWDIQMRVYPILDAILNISKTMEEGFWPRGKLAFVLKAHIQNIQDLVLFPELERPSLRNFKHVRKLMQAVEESSDHFLVSDGSLIAGIGSGEMPPHSIVADFAGPHGFVSFDGEALCSFFDGRFHSSSRRANLVQVEEILLEYSLSPTQSSELLKTIKEIVHHAEDHKHGCTLVIDLSQQPIDIAGQKLDKPLDISRDDYLALAMNLSKVDGALHIRPDRTLRSFACILDGRAIPGEDRARGARFNSALRFTAMYDDLIVIVVSSDRPVSILQSGVELTAHCYWKPVSSCMSTPPTLMRWIENKKD